MTVNKIVRIQPDQYKALQELGRSMRPPCTPSAIVIEMVRERLPKWQKGYLRKNGK